jgi:toxin ParE1/3/4
MRARRFGYAPLALADLADIHTYLSQAASVAVANRVVDRIRGHIRRQRETPLSGAPRPDLADGCRLTVNGRYVIYYAIVGENMTVLRVLHHARDRDAIMGGVQEEAASFEAFA